MPRRAAGTGSRAAAALKGRSNNQPSCYVGGSATTGVGMMSAGHYTVPEHVRAKLNGATVEEVAKASHYFKDLAVPSGGDDGGGEEGASPADPTNMLASFLQNRGPSFGPEHGPQNGAASVFGVSRIKPPQMTPSALRGAHTADNASVYRGVSRARAAARKAHFAAEAGNLDAREEDSGESDDYEYSDDDNFEDDEGEDEPFVGGPSEVERQVKTEEEKQALLAQAFAYVSQLEKNMAREADEEARQGRRRRKGRGKGSSRGKGGKSSGNHSKKSAARKQSARQAGKGSGGSRSASSVQSNKERSRRARMGHGDRRVGEDADSTSSGRGTNSKKQTRLYGGGGRPSISKFTSSRVSKNSGLGRVSGPSAPSAPVDTHTLSPRVEAHNDAVPRRPLQTGKTSSARNERPSIDVDNLECSENAISASNTLTGTSTGRRKAKNVVFGKKLKGAGRPQLPPSSVSDSASSSLLNPTTDSGSTTRRRKKDLTQEEMAMLIGQLESGTAASQLRAELEKAKENTRKAESAFDAARAEFAGLL